MASIADQCWTSSEDLFRDVDLDALYERQLRAIGGESCKRYPYLILIHTGKITLGINLGRDVGQSDWLFAPVIDQEIDEATPFVQHRIEESSE
jgi:hypothetical protein